MRKTYMLWAGTVESFEEYCDLIERFTGQTELAGQVIARDQDKKAPGDGQPASRLLKVDNGVGVISIHGMLTNRDAWWNEFAGLVSYNEIRQAAIEALGTDSVKEILLDISSPGGTVAGVKDAVDTLLMVGKVKTITAYSDSTAASAGYWLMASAKKRYVSDVAVIGSIGVLFKHFEYTKQLEQQGVTATVIRAGEYKGLGNDVEVLSAKARTAIEGMANHIYGVFVQSVADLLGLSYQLVDSKMAQGREFVGSQAVDVGLVDAVASFDKVYAATVNRVAKKSGGADMTKRYTMTAADLAAVASGASVAGEGENKFSTEGVDNAAEGSVAEGAEAIVDEAENVDGSDGEAEAEAAAEDAEAEDTASQQPSLEAVDLLKSQLAEVGDKLLEAKVEAKEFSKELDKLTAQVEPMKKIVSRAVNNMLVALGGSEADLSNLSSAELVARHTEVAKQFEKKFSVGGVAALEDKESETSKPSATGLERARLKVVRARRA